MKSRTLLAATLAIALAAPLAAAEDLNVPSDDYPTVQSAVDAVQTGDTIILKGGPFVENVVRADMPADVTIKGKGKPTIDAGQNGTGLDFTGGSGLTITGIGVTNASNHGIRLDACPGATVSRCIVSNAGSTGIHVNECPGVVIERNTLEIIDDDGILIQNLAFGGGGTTGPALVSRNRCSGCGKYGIRAQGLDNVTVERNRVQDGTDGIGVTPYIGGSGGAAPKISRNKMFDLTGIGIVVAGTDGTVERNGMVRILGVSLSAGGSDILFDRNKIIDSGSGSAAPGIENFGQRNEFTRNRVTRCLGHAVLERGSGTDYSRNTLILPSAHGFDIQPFGNGTYFRNRVIRPGEDGFNVGQGANTFERNLVSKGGDDGFQVFSDGNRFESNSVTRCESRGFQIESGNNTLISNKATRCSTGFDVRSDPNQFTGNKAKGNSEFDLHDRTGDTLNTYDDDNKFKTEEFDDPIVP